MVALGLLAASAQPAEAASPSRAKLVRSDGTPGVQHADKLHRTDPRRQLTIGVNLALRNEAQLEAFIAQVSDPKSPNYGHYLTPEQFAATYGPTQAQVQQVVGHLRASGLSVGSVSSNRTIVDATGPVSAMEAAFGVTISDWHDRDQNRDFFGNDSEPTLPTALASYVVGVAGLNNHYPLHRLGPAPRVGGGPAGGYTPNELKKAYDVTPLASAGYNGGGQRLGLFELDGFRQSNITVYDAQYGLGSPAPATVLVSGGPGPLGGGEIEVELDIEVMHAIAPASPITVWEGPNSDPGVNATYNAMVTSNTTKSNSTSWGICEPNTTQAEMTTLDNIFKQAAAQGQSFYAASGDNGAYDCGTSRLTVDSPANDPYVTGTGGTNLTLNADSTYKSESAWSNANTARGTGGGLSGYFARPSWQTGPGVANTYSNGKRQVPDVALDADPQTGYSVYVTYQGSTGWNVVGGTSAGAPAWAAFTGVYNQYAAANGKPNLGYTNPTLYSTGSNAQPYPPYHDITTGDNLYYPTTANWDYATGWGSFDGNNVARDVAATLALPGAPTGVVATAGSGAATVSWTAPSSNGGSPINKYIVTSSPSGFTATAGGTDTWATVKGLTAGTAYTFTVTASNGSGTGPASSPSNSVIPYAGSTFEDSSSSVTYAGSWGVWSNPGNSGGTAHYSAQTGASATLFFTGPYVGVTYLKDFNGGIVTISIDGAVVDQLDTYGAVQTFHQQKYYAVADGPHSIAVRVSGSKNPTSAYTWITFDAFVAQAALPPGTVFEDSSTLVTYSGSWGVWSNPGNSGGTAHYSGQTGASTTLYFSGPYVGVVYLTDVNGGIATVSIDGAVVDQLDTYAAVQTFQQQKFYAVANGPHRITVRVSGNRNPASASTWITLDAFVAQTGLPTGIVFEDSSASVAYSGAWLIWSNPGNSGGTAHYSSQSGATATLSFSGSYFGVVYLKDINGGIATISLDGAAVDQLDTYAAVQAFQQQKFYPVSVGSHTISVTISGNKNPSSAYSWITFDAFTVPASP